MKKFVSSIYALATLAVATLAFTACSSSDDITEEQPVNPAQKTYTLVINASKGDDGTRALKAGDHAVDVYWTGNETFDVVDYNVKIGTATAAASPNGETTITATLTQLPTQSLIFYLNGSVYDYTGQVGLLTGANSISEKYDFARASLTIVNNNGYGDFSVVGDEIVLNGEKVLTFYSAQAIVKFTLLDNATNEPINATSLTIHDNNGNLNQIVSLPTTWITGDITITPAGTNVVYAALNGVNHSNLTLTATDGTDTWTYSKSDVSFYGGEYREITVKMTKYVPECSYTAPTLVSGTLTYNGNARELVTGGSATNATIYYSTDGGNNWSTSVPTGTNAGTYTVYYKVVPADGYSGGVESTLVGSKTINKINWSGYVTVESTGYGYRGRYNGSGNIIKWESSNNNGSSWTTQSGTDNPSPTAGYTFKTFRVTIGGDTNHNQTQFTGSY